MADWMCESQIFFSYSLVCSTLKPSDSVIHFNVNASNNAFSVAVTSDEPWSPLSTINLKKKKYIYNNKEDFGKKSKHRVKV